MVHRVFLDNAQGVPAVSIVDDKDVICAKIYFCKDGGIVAMDGKVLGFPLGVRSKDGQAAHIDAPETDGILVGKLSSRLDKNAGLGTRPEA